MNNTSNRPKHQSGDGSRRNASSEDNPATPAPVETLEAKISSLKFLRITSPSAALSKDAAAADADVDVDARKVPTKSENSKPGPTLNPASCASGLAFIGGGGGTSDLSLTALAERINNSVQGTTRRRNESLQNDDWDDLHSPQVNMFLGTDYY